MGSFLDRYSFLDISNWSGPALTAFRIALIIVAAWLIASALRRVGIAFCGRIVYRLHGRDRVKRAETLERVVSYGASVTITLIAAVLILSEIGVLFILLENQMITGDVVKIADRTGTVEDVTLRYVRLRDSDGSVHHVPNSEIKVVTNIRRGESEPPPEAAAPTAEAPAAPMHNAKKKRATQAA